MLTKKEIKKLLPKGAKHLSMGNYRCSFMLGNEIITKDYYTLAKEREGGEIMGLTKTERYNRNLHRIFEDAKILKATYTGHSCVVCNEGITWEDDYTGEANICGKCSGDIPY